MEALARRCLLWIALIAFAPLVHCGVAWGAQDLMVFYEVVPRAGDAKADTDLHLQRVSQAGKCQFGEGRGLPVATSNANETSPAACPDGAGGAIVAYCYEFTEGDNKGDSDVVAQRFSAEGNALWNEGNAPQPVAASKGPENHPVILSDGQGGAFIVLQWASRDDDPGKTDILAQRISAQGEMLWNEGKKPVAVGASQSPERKAAVVSDGQGGIIVVFEWVGDDGDIDIMANRLSPGGQLLWEKNGKSLDVAASKAIERSPVAVSDGQGGAIVVFEYEYTDGEHKGDVDLMAQRVAADGTLLWGEGKAPAYVCAAKAPERNPTAVSDGSGGVIAAGDYVVEEGPHVGDRDALAQRLDSQGRWLWNAGKRSAPLATSNSDEGAVCALPAGDGGAIFAFEAMPHERERAGDQDLWGQRLNRDGQLLWRKGEYSIGLATSKWLEHSPLLLPDGDGGFFLVFGATGPANTTHAGDEDIQAARFSGGGEPLWNNGEKSVDIAATNALERNPCAITVPAK